MYDVRTYKVTFAALALLAAISVNRGWAGEPAAENRAVTDETPVVSQYDMLRTNMQGELETLLETHELKRVAIDPERAKLAVAFCATAERAVSFGQLDYAERYYRLSLSMSPLYWKSISGLQQVRELILQSRNS